MNGNQTLVAIKLNGKPYRVRDGQSLQELVDLLGYQEKRIAIEHNQCIVARSRYPQCQLRADDKIEIVQAIGGG